jgi:hypothetical protein
MTELIGGGESSMDGDKEMRVDCVEDGSTRVELGRRILESIRPPAVPVEGTWSISLSSVINHVFSVPGLAVRALSALDRFGSMRLSATSIGFDSDDVDWSAVTQISTTRLADVLTDQALEREADRLKVLIPPLPGRKWILGKATAVLGGVSSAVLERVGHEALERPVVSEIAFKGRLGRRRSMSPGLLATALMGAYPTLMENITQIADRAGATVVPT